MSINRPYEDISELPNPLAVFPLNGVLLLPREQLSLNIFEPRYLKLFDDALTSRRLIGMIQPAIGQNTSDETPRLASIGCLGRITQLSETGDGRYMTTLTGVARFRVVDEEVVGTPYRQCHVSYVDFERDLHEDAGLRREDAFSLLKAFEKARRLEFAMQNIGDVSACSIVNFIAMKLPFTPQQLQMLLEAISAHARFEALMEIAKIELAEMTPTSSRLH
jgi:Lon protease-like protein